MYQNLSIAVAYTNSYRNKNLSSEFISTYCATSKLDPSFWLQFFVAVVKQINSCHIVMKISCKSN